MLPGNGSNAYSQYSQIRMEALEAIHPDSIGRAEQFISTY